MPDPAHQANTGQKAESDPLFSAILRIVYDAVIAIGEDQHITLFNQGAERIFGHTAADMIGQPLDVLLPLAKAEAHRAQIRDWAAGSETARLMGQRREISGRRKDGTIFPAEASIAKVTQGGQTTFAVILRDISERKQIEAAAWQSEELRRSNADLEQFAYVASHDLQEPLRMVASYAKLLAKRYQGQFDPDADEFISYVVDGATRMQQLINSLLAYSRIGTRGKQFAPVACEAVLDQVLLDLAVSVEESGAVVTRDPLPTVIADETQLTQLFQNLLSNAVRFRSQRPPEIHISAERRTGDWLFSVRDNGIGIEPQYFDRIFVIFQRLHTRAEYPGTGIGLAVCKKIVERHGGRIWAESEPGQGATFFFTLPVSGDV